MFLLNLSVSGIRSCFPKKTGRLEGRWSVSSLLAWTMVCELPER